MLLETILKILNIRDITGEREGSVLKLQYVDSEFHSLFLVQ